MRAAHLRDHVHAHSITRLCTETNVEGATGHRSLEGLQATEASRRVEGGLEDVRTLVGVDPPLGGSALGNVGELEGGTASHSVLSDDSGDTAADVEGLATTGGRSDESAFGGGHGDGEDDAVDAKRTSDTDGNRHVTNDVLAALTHDARVVVVEIGEVGGLEGLASGSASCRGRKINEEVLETGRERTAQMRARRMATARS
jgi:hypothetical protein